MKSQFLVVAFSIVFLSLFTFFSSCKKINQATELGDNLVPAADNVHTFEVALSTITQNGLFDDTTQVIYTDPVAVGDIADPEFGPTHANLDFSIYPATNGAYPFVKPDSLAIDSVVLSLAYEGAYGDTVGNGISSVHVYEISPSSGFNDTTLYKYTDPATDFATTGTELGSAVFTVKSLKDTLTLIRGTDTTTATNVVRIRLDNSLGTRFSQFDTTNGYKNDSIFNQLFRGLAIKADPVGNVLTYFNLSDVSNTKLTVYYRYGKSDTSSFDFNHSTIRGISNYINRQVGGNYLTYLGNGAGDKIYLQSAPGSFATIKIPALDTFGNKVIHRAEIIADKIPSSLDDIFSAPPLMMLDRKNKLTPDTVFLFPNDLIADALGNVGFSAFGGTLLADNSVHFNISRYIQSVVTKHVANDTLRLYAPLRTYDFSTNLHTVLPMRVNEAIAKGRIVLGGGSYADPSKRLRLRIIYSDL